MTLTEEQRAALKRVAAYMDDMYAIASPYHGCTEDSDLLRAMIDSSGTVEPTGGFDLEAARAGIAHYRIENPSNVDTESALKELVDQANLAEDAIAEIERLLARDRQAAAAIVAMAEGTKQHVLKTQAIMKCVFDEADQLAGYCEELGNIVIAKDAKIADLETKIERLRPFEIAARDLDSDLTKIAGERDDQAARIKELEADLEQAERVIEARSEVIDQQAALTKSLKKEIGRLKHESKVEQEFTNSYILHLHEAEARIKELEADNQNLVTMNKALMKNDRILRDNNGKYRKRAQKAELLNKSLKSKIGPDAKPRSWQITEERKAALAAMSNLSETISCPDCGVWIGFADIGPHMAVLRAMLREAE